METSRRISLALAVLSMSNISPALYSKACSAIAEDLDAPESYDTISTACAGPISADAIKACIAGIKARYESPETSPESVLDDPEPKEVGAYWVRVCAECGPDERHSTSKKGFSNYGLAAAYATKTATAYSAAGGSISSVEIGIG